MVRLVKKEREIPCAVGFGISTPEQARRMASAADGVIVGSAVVKLCAQYGEEAAPYVAEYVREMKAAVREGGR
ncbi:Tryptophan synthase alpha chain [bioreactor metagenome]